MKIEFVIIDTVDHDSICKSVEASLNDGWELHGNLIAFPNYTDSGKVEAVRYVQALIKKTDENAGQYRFG